jgi:hypothetical protein
LLSCLARCHTPPCKETRVVQSMQRNAPGALSRTRTRSYFFAGPARPVPLRARAGRMPHRDRAKQAEERRHQCCGAVAFRPREDFDRRGSELPVQGPTALLGLGHGSYFVSVPKPSARHRPIFMPSILRRALAQALPSTQSGQALPQAKAVPFSLVGCSAFFMWCCNSCLSSGLSLVWFGVA